MSRDFVVRRDERKRLFAEMGESDGGGDAASDQDEDEPEEPEEPPVDTVEVILSSEVDEEDIIRSGKWLYFTLL